MDIPNRTYFYGALGSTLPVALNFINADPTTLFMKISLFEILGHIAISLTLIYIAILMVWFNKEKDSRKAFQIGAVAPMLAVALLGTNKISKLNDDIERHQAQIKDLVCEYDKTKCDLSEKTAETRLGLKLHFFSIAYAQDIEELRDKHRTQSVFRQFWAGFTGVDDYNWFVIVGSHINADDAEAQKKLLEESGYNAKVFPPFENNEYYGVMLASFVSYPEANAIRQNALKNGLPKDTYLWQAK